MTRFDKMATKAAVWTCVAALVMICATRGYDMADEQTHLRIGNEMRRVYDLILQPINGGKQHYHFFTRPKGKELGDTPCVIEVGQCSYYDAVLLPSPGAIVIAGVTKKGGSTL